MSNRITNPLPNHLHIQRQPQSEKMAAKDLFHEAVRRGLEKDQWIITDDPLELEWEEVKSGVRSHVFLAEV